MMIVLTSFGELKAQTFDEWFKQRKTQEKYLLQQIGGLQLYISYVKEGYKIAGRGLNMIDDAKHGEFNLHHQFNQSLMRINPRIKKSRLVSEIEQYDVLIKTMIDATLRKIKLVDELSITEKQYIKQVLDKTVAGNKTEIAELENIIDKSFLIMNDGERLTRISTLHKDIEERYRFVKSFSADVIWLINSKMLEAYEIRKSREINNLKND